MESSAGDVPPPPSLPLTKANGPVPHGLAIQFGLMVLLIAAWIVFRIRFMLHGGPLWRDEIVSLNISSLPSIADIWHNLYYDSFPILWPLVLRLWFKLGLTSTTLGLRLFGFLVGIGILAGILFNAWQFRIRAPILALALLGFNASMITQGGSIRGYGLGVVLELFTFGLIWDVATRPTRWRIVAALLVSIASVHVLFFNSVILAAAGCGAIAVAAYQRQWKRTGIVIVIGLLCAASMIVYQPIVHGRESFNRLLLANVTLKLLGEKFADSVSYDPTMKINSFGFNLIVWGAILLLTIVLGAAALISSRRRAADAFRTDLVLYNLFALCAALVGYGFFLRRLSYGTERWYYLALLALLAVATDAIINSLQSDRMRMLMSIATVAFCSVAASPLWIDTGMRKTAMDSDAARLAQLAKPGDLIIISPWFFATSFHRYYHGEAPYLTVPPTEFLDLQEYDQIVPWMQNPNAMDSTLHRIGDVLKSGHTVYLFGEFIFPSTDLNYPTIPPPDPDDPMTWVDTPYYFTWQRQITFYLARHSLQIVPVDIDVVGVSGYECPWLYASRGWTDTP